MSYNVYVRDMSITIYRNLQKLFQDSTDVWFEDWVRIYCNCRFIYGATSNDHYFSFDSEEDYFLFLMRWR